MSTYWLLHFIQSSYSFTFDMAVMMTIFLGCHFQQRDYQHLLQDICRFNFSRDTETALLLNFMHEQEFSVGFFCKALCCQTQVFMADSVASHWGLAPPEAPTMNFPDG